MKIQQRVIRQPRVEMLPLIDIVFLLLIFFIYAMLSMAVHRGLDLDLPESSTAQISQEAVLSISVKKNGPGGSGLFILVNETQVKLEQLGAHLKKRTQGQRSRKVLIFAEESISYQELFEVLDQIKHGGLQEISLQANRAGE